MSSWCLAKKITKHHTEKLKFTKWSGWIWNQNYSVKVSWTELILIEEIITNFKTASVQIIIMGKK